MTDALIEFVTQLSWRLVMQALPVQDQSVLLKQLAETWCQVTQSVCLIGIWDGESLQACRATANAQTSLRNCRLTGWNDAALLELFGDSTGNETVQASSHVRRAFFHNGDVIGGFVARTSDRSLEDLAPLVEVSEKLIAQLRAFDCELRDRKLEAMAEFAAGAGHEINNPLATIAGRAALLLKTETDPERRRSLETIGGQAYRVRDMIGDAMTFARPSKPQPVELTPLDEIRAVLNCFADKLRSKIAINISGHESVTITADREQFRTFMSCLVRNEIEALVEGGTCSITVAQCPNREAEFVRITLRDDGQGLTEIEREHLFDPFFSGRQAGRGLGFGLTKCWRIIGLHGGYIDAGGNSETGFWLTADWPIAYLP